MAWRGTFAVIAEFARNPKVRTRRAGGAPGARAVAARHTARLYSSCTVRERRERPRPGSPSRSVLRRRWRERGACAGGETVGRRGGEVASEGARTSKRPRRERARAGSDWGVARTRTGTSLHRGARRAPCPDASCESARPVPTGGPEVAAPSARPDPRQACALAARCSSALPRARSHETLTAADAALRGARRTLRHATQWPPSGLRRV